MIQSRVVKFSQKEAEQFYEEHKGKVVIMITGVDNDDDDDDVIIMNFSTTIL